MESKKTKCKLCGEEFTYWPMANSQMDVGKVPQICNRKSCVTNYEYAQSHADPITGDLPDLDYIKKWKK